MSIILNDNIIHVLFDSVSGLAALGRRPSPPVGAVGVGTAPQYINTDGGRLLAGAGGPRGADNVSPLQWSRNYENQVYVFVVYRCVHTLIFYLCSSVSIRYACIH